MESDQLLLLLTAVTTGITLVLNVLVIARTRKIGEQLRELDALKRSVREVQLDFAEIVRVSNRTFIELQRLSGVGLHFRQIRREQLVLADKFQRISSAMDALSGLLQSRDAIKTEHQDEIKEIIETSRSLQEWRSRMTAVYADAGHLFESEPIRELIDRLGPELTYAAQPPARSAGRTRSSQRKVRPRRQR
jgi:hypothetical protein